MIGTSKLEYIFIRLAIGVLRLVAPASLAYLAASLLLGRFPCKLGVIALAESSFYLLVYLPRRIRLQQARVVQRFIALF